MKFAIYWDYVHAFSTCSRADQNAHAYRHHFSNAKAEQQAFNMMEERGIVKSNANKKLNDYNLI